ncbi:Basic blue protein [Hibiscus syriacus]|uniref:Basic blue protein n=1 Tax=Hibiscus syriacus TaxID=106335 RepID=A0A6A2Z7I3_HIBSY|nr:basic blue protein-like [Hibiscus syriacus]KAE8687075.1 Basic blue protein [Hibiscus syriacus]
MVQGRGSAIAAAALLCLLCVHLELAQAATYTVGGTGGWTFNSVSWTKGKRFKAGDTLVFDYNPSLHNVVAVNKAGYNSCTTPKGAKVYRSGKDRIKLTKGQNYFICNVVGHCQSGMKIAVTAA